MVNVLACKKPYHNYVKNISHFAPAPVVLLHSVLIAAFALQMLMTYPTLG